MTDEPRELKKDHTGDIEDIATRFGRLEFGNWESRASH